MGKNGTPTKATFCEKLQAFRERAGLSRNALARMVGIDGSHLNRIERGLRNPPRPETLLRIGEALQLSEQEKKELLFLSGQQRHTQKPPSTPAKPSVGVTFGSGITPEDMTVDEIETPAVVAVRRLLSNRSLTKEERKQIEDHILNLVSLLQNRPKANGTKSSSGRRGTKTKESK